MKKRVKVGNITLGDGNIYIQSMLNIPASDTENSVKQAVELEKAGCRIIRAAIPTLRRAVTAVEKIPFKREISFQG